MRAVLEVSHALTIAPFVLRSQMVLRITHDETK